MDKLADPDVIQLAFLFPFIPIIAVGIVTFILGYDLREDADNDDDDDDDKGMLQPAWGGI